jgi:hypothetical protein
MLWFLQYLFYSSLLLPNNSTVCKVTEMCPIAWEQPMNAHIEVQVSTGNNSWTSTTEEDKSFLSVIVDDSKTEYEWGVPQYLAKRWESPKRVVITNLDNAQEYYSDNFTVMGVTFTNNFPLSVTSSTYVPISWQSNEEELFAVYLIKDEYDIKKIENSLLPQNYTYMWNVPYEPNKQMKLW